MLSALNRNGLETIETARREAGKRIAGSADGLSRASVSRAGGVSDVQVWRGLAGRAEPRTVTVAAAAHGLLARMLQETSAETVIVSDNFPGRVAQAAQALATEMNTVLAAPTDQNARRRLRGRIEKLGELVSGTIADHFRIEKALRLLCEEWLDNPDNGVKLGAMGAAIAVVNARVALKLDSAHV